MSDPEHAAPFLAGVIEGFYGRPWDLSQRSTLFERMSAWDLNTYLYGPKDDLKHRAAWREEYSTEELAQLAQSVKAAQECGIRFVYAIGPGLDIQYSNDSDLQSLRCRFEQLRTIGVVDFAILFDDIPDAMSDEDRRRFGSFAVAQASVSNVLYRESRDLAPDSVFLFCPTPYCSRMDQEGLGGEGYLETIGHELEAGIQIFWTGPQIISREVLESHLEALTKRLRRRPLIWDNYHANDYDLRRLYTGPIAGRPEDPRKHLSGIMMNPNCEFEANYLPCFSLGRYVNPDGNYDPRRTYVEGLGLWLSAAFESVGKAWTMEELELFSSIYYLPFELGATAQKMLDDVSVLIQEPQSQWGDQESRFHDWRELIQSISVKLTELKNRDLFYTFNRQWWEIREEFELLARFIAHKKESGEGVPLPSSPEHLLGTYRGGAIHQLQGLLSMGSSGQFSEAQRKDQDK